MPLHRTRLLEQLRHVTMPLRRQLGQAVGWDAAPVDVSYAVVAEFEADQVPTDQQVAVTDLLRRNEVVQVIWAKHGKPQPRPAQARLVLVATVLLNHTATDRDADEVRRALGGLGLVSEVRVERPGPPQNPVPAVGVTPPAVPHRPHSAGG